MRVFASALPTLRHVRVHFSSIACVLKRRLDIQSSAMERQRTRFPSGIFRYPQSSRNKIPMILSNSLFRSQIGRIRVLVWPISSLSHSASLSSQPRSYRGLQNPSSSFLEKLTYQPLRPFIIRLFPRSMPQYPMRPCGLNALAPPMAITSTSLTARTPKAT